MTEIVLINYISADNLLEHTRKVKKLGTYSNWQHTLFRYIIKYVGIAIMLCTTSIAMSQHQPTIDSLNSLIPDATEKQRVDIYIAIAYEYQYSDSANTYKHANLAIELANKLELPEKVIDANDLKAWVCMTQGNYNEARKLYLQVAEDAKLIDYKQGEARAFGGLGIIYRQRGNYSEALESLFKSLTINQAIRDTFAMSGDYNNIATVYSTQGEYEKALEYHNRSLEIKINQKELRKTATSYNNIGVIYWKMKELDKALENYQKSLEIQEQVNDKMGLAGSYINIGEVYTEQGRYDEALNYLNQAIQLSNEINDRVSLIYSLVGLGQTHSRKGNLMMAKKYFQRAIEVAEEIGYPTIVRDAAGELAEVENKLGNYKSAYDAHRKHKILSDSLYNESISKRIAKLEAENEFRKERDSIAFSYERERVRYVAELKYSQVKQTATYVGLGLLLVIAIVLFLFYQSKQKANHQLGLLNNEIYNQNEEITEKNEALSQANEHLTELNKTKSRFFSIISHDIRRPMNLMLGFYSIIKSHLESEYNAKEDKRLQEMSGHLNTASDGVLNLLDNLLSWAMKEEGSMPYNPEYLNIKETLEECLSSIELQAQSKSIKLETDIPKSVKGWVDLNGFMTIIRNLTGNALKFTPEGGTITLGAYKENGKIRVTVSDTGIGIPEEKLDNLYEINEEKVSDGTRGEKGSGLGLNIVYDLVKLNRGYIEVESVENDHTTFTMFFPSSEPM